MLIEKSHDGNRSLPSPACGREVRGDGSGFSSSFNGLHHHSRPLSRGKERGG